MVRAAIAASAAANVERRRVAVRCGALRFSCRADALPLRAVVVAGWWRGTLGSLDTGLTGLTVLRGE